MSFLGMGILFIQKLFACLYTPASLKPYLNLLLTFHPIGESIRHALSQSNISYERKDLFKKIV
jgi:hypothetical protein